MNALVVSLLLALMAVIVVVDAQADDLDVRFNKVVMIYDVPGTDLPLTSAHYPINADTFRWLRYSSAYSVTFPGSCMECDWDLAELVETIGGPPTHPTSDESDPYWEELNHVVEIQHLRRQGVAPSTLMPLPDLWIDLTIEQVAESVHNEYPGKAHVALLETMDQAREIVLDYNVIPFTSVVEFVRGMVMIADLVTWAIARAGSINFGLKYHVGRARPEEVVYQISTGKISSGVPADLLADIVDLNLEDAESFTAYPEGSPMHPSWPAMHSAGSALSLWLAVVLDLTDEQWCQVKLTDYAVSYARTVAGGNF
mmetsp:Transcript_19912/g.33064  ORF Transcript_19912/g.33064 Transcript_19912/m.33064 type:complete len:312 (-) Transcript_19912:9-944(-)